MTPCMSATSCALCRVDFNSWLKHTSCWPCTDHQCLDWVLACTSSRKCMYLHHEFGTPSMSYIYTCVGMFRVMGCDVSFELYHLSSCLTYQQNGGGRKLTVHRTCSLWAVLVVVVFLQHDLCPAHIGCASKQHFFVGNLGRYASSSVHGAELHTDYIDNVS